MSIKELKQNCVVETVIEKSKFICYCFVVHSLQEVEACLSKLENEHIGATHICYAYKLLGYEKCSDNGEPQGTAGKPMLDVIKKKDISNVLVAIVRYFGGIKLGAGGLVRAYSNCTSNGIEKAGEVVREQCKKISFCVGLEQNKQIGIAKKLPYVLNTQIAYGENICISMFVKETDLAKCQTDLNNIFMTSLNFDVDSNNFYF